MNCKDIVAVRKDLVTDYSSLPWGTRWRLHWSRVDVTGVVVERSGMAGYATYTERES